MHIVLIVSHWAMDGLIVWWTLSLCLNSQEYRQLCHTGPSPLFFVLWTIPRPLSFRLRTEFSRGKKNKKMSSLHRQFRFAFKCIRTLRFVWQTQLPSNSQSPISLPASYLVIHYSHLLLPSLHIPARLHREMDSHIRLPWQKIHMVLTSLLQVGN